MQAGRVIDERYRLEAFLGEGAVGSVFRATDLRDTRIVAIKIWNGNTQNAQTLGRFEREAAALSAMHHPNIVYLYGHGIVDELPYVAMEYLQGETLDARLSEGAPLPPMQIFDIARQIFAALAYAHGLGVVHRDLKPDNVYLARNDAGRIGVKLLDYGLAKFMTPSDDPVKGAALTMTGMMMGTPLYMPPEQAAGKKIDARVDVYAAGCVLFEMLSGQPPFLGESHAEIFRAHMIAPVPKLAELRPTDEVHPALQALFEKALAKKPEQRYADAGELLAALNALPQPVLRARSSGSDFRSSVVTELGLPTARKPGNTLLIACALACVVVAAAVAVALLR